MKISSPEKKDRVLLYLLTISLSFGILLGILFGRGLERNMPLLMTGEGLLFLLGIFLAAQFVRHGIQKKDQLLKNEISYLVNEVPSPFFVLSGRELIYMNKAMKALTNVEKNDVKLPFDFYEYIPAEQLSEVETWLTSVRQLKTTSPLTLKLNLLSNASLWLNLHGAVIGSSERADILVSAFDISAMKKNELMQKKLGDLKDQIILLADSIQSHDSLVPLLERILDIALSKISKSLFGSFLVLENNEYFRIAAYRGFPPEEIDGAFIPLEKSLAYVASNGKIQKTQIIKDVLELPNIDDKLLSFTDSITWALRSTLTTPIFINGTLYGSINIDSKEPNAFTEEDAMLMEFFRENVEKAIEKTEHMIQLRTLSYLDSLTGLYNRAYFEEAATELIYQADREDKPFSVAVIDLDCLKSINDCHGHSGGDMLLRHFSEVLRSVLPEDSTVCRYGGDEFTLLFPDMKETEVFPIMEKLVHELKEKNLRFGDCMIPVTLSYGVSEYVPGTRTLLSTLERADSKMYEMKWLHKKEVVKKMEETNNDSRP